MSSNKNNQSDEHRHRRLFTFACGAIVSPNTLYIADAWGASRNAIHVFYSVAVWDALSLRSLRSFRLSKLADSPRQCAGIWKCPQNAISVLLINFLLILFHAAVFCMVMYSCYYEELRQTMNTYTHKKSTGRTFASACTIILLLFHSTYLFLKWSVDCGCQDVSSNNHFDVTLWSGAVITYYQASDNIEGK